MFDPLQHEDAVALFSRIRFMRLFYAALAAIMRREPVSIPEAERCLASCNELVCIMQNTIGRGLKPKQAKDEEGNKGKLLIPPVVCLFFLWFTFFTHCCHYHRF